MKATRKTMLLECFIKPKTKINFRDQAWNKPPGKCWVKNLFHSISIMPHFFFEDSNSLNRLEKKDLKSNCIKNELVQEDFSSILLQLKVTSLDSPEIVKTVLQSTS